MNDRFKEAHERLNSIKWGDFIYYDQTSPTFIKWKNPMRVGNKGTPTPRHSTVAGSVNSNGLLIFVHNKKIYSIPKIIWVMHNGAIPEGFTVWFRDNNSRNAEISNLYLEEINQKLKEKYDQKIHRYIKYDESSPSCITWVGKISKSSHISLGDACGSFDPIDGYWKLHALGYHYKVHRLVWYLNYGKIPDGYHVDHIDRDRSNNKIENLRVIPPSINGKNRSKNKNSKTGINGVTYSEFYDKRGTLIRKYTVTITCNGKRFNRSFSVNKYGKERALELAIEAKDKIFNILNKNNAGFTKDHGM